MEVFHLISGAGLENLSCERNLIAGRLHDWLPAVGFESGCDRHLVLSAVLGSVEGPWWADGGCELGASWGTRIHTWPFVC